ncbi:MAG: PAS domain-containing sensor histidine kinase [Oscillospiraceae bacterium]|nr:PAS domain-containing sensor histidine kinase [Oscillospiraceae bacterium]
MTRRIFNSISTVAITVLLSSVLVIIGVLYNYFSDAQMLRLSEETDMVARGVSIVGEDFINRLDIDDYRITWIDDDGTVLYDSHGNSNSMENHAEREEIIQAIQNGHGESKRYSATLTEQYLYYARRMDNGTIIRLSVSQSTVFSLIWNMAQPICVVLLIAVIASLLLATQLSRSIINPLNNLNLDSPLDNPSYDELSPLLRRIDSQQKELKLQAYELQKRKDELDIVIGSMNEGIVLLKANGYVISINRAAKHMLSIKGRAEGKQFIALCRNTDIIAILEKARQGKQVEDIIDLAGGRYQIDASPVISDNKIAGTALLLFDVTEKENLEQMRREFTANVSHELKSPLHSISGYSELIMTGMATGDDSIRFSQRIHAEAQRMTQLIQDIISLSQLDEGIGDMQMQPVDLNEAAVSVSKELKEKADENNISLKVQGDTPVIKAIPHLIYSIIYNLTENAIKYNRENGQVIISVKEDEGSVNLSVKDTGIGIPPEHQNHIFERFYRVDKSRSKRQGGSGLGLSIVKHAALVHNAKITLDSVYGEGTKITVIFPKNI